MTIFEEIAYLTSQLPLRGSVEKKEIKARLATFKTALQKQCCLKMAYTNNGMAAMPRRKYSKDGEICYTRKEKEGKKVFYIKSFFYDTGAMALILYTRIHEHEVAITVKKNDGGFEYTTDMAGKGVSTFLRQKLDYLLGYWIDGEAASWRPHN